MDNITELARKLENIEARCFDSGWTAEMLAEELRSPLCVFAVEHREDTAVAYALGRVAADEGELFRLAVLPDFRRQGLAAALLSRLLQEMARRGAAKCFLEVRSDNIPARALYRKAGFAEIAERRGYYSDGADAVIMAKSDI